MFVLTLLFYALLAVALFVFFELLFPFLMLYVENRLSTHNKVKMAESPSMYTLAIVFVAEWLLTLVKHYTYPLIYFYKDLNYGKAKKCIVLLHGYGRNHYDLWWMKNNLTIKDSVICTLNLPLSKQSFETSAAELRAILLRLKNTTECEEMILVGHSLGGIICSMAVEEDENIKRMISKIVCICSPFHGTKIAAFTPENTFRQLQPNAKVLMDLVAKIEQSSSNYLLFVSSCDHIVIPWDSPIIQSKRYEIIADNGHLMVLNSKKVLNSITNFINETQDA